MTIKTHGRMMTNKTIGADQLAVSDYGTDNQALVTDGAGSIRWATVGIGGSVGSSTYVENIFAGDDSKTKFQMTATAALEESLLVFVDGVAQPTSAFTLTSSGVGIGANSQLDEINVSPALATGQQLRVCHLGINTAIADGSITGAKLSFPPAAGGDLLYHNGTQYDRFPIGTAGQLFATNGAATAPEWILGDTAGDILFYNGTNYEKLGIGTAGQLLATNAGATAPYWLNATTAALPAVGADGNVLTSDGSDWSSQPPLGGVGGELVSIQSFTATNANHPGLSHTWTRPSGVTRIRVCIVGGGGGSWSSGGANQGTSGGAGGAGYCESIFDVTNVSTATILVGAGGLSAGNPGSLATPSTFTATGLTTMTAGGGQPQQNPNVAGGSGGTATGGQLNIPGGIGKHNTAGISNVGNPADGGLAGGPFGARIGRGRNGCPETGQGQPGYCKIYEYSDASASLVGEKLVSHQLFTSSSTATGTWTKPANITKIKVYVVGPGGASGHTVGTSHSGMGGGGGCALSVLDVTNVTSYPYVIGGTSISGNLTVTSVDSSFNTTIVGGAGGSSAGGGTAGGSGGNATGGQLNFTGASGESSDGSGAGPLGGNIGRGKLSEQPQSGWQGSGGSAAILVEEYSDASLVSGGSLVPTGVLNPYAGATAPAGWLLCFGQAISRTVYSTLFTAIGTTYGVGDGSTTFLLPDMRGRAVAGQDDMGGTSANILTAAAADTLGGTLGTETHKHSPDGVAGNPIGEYDGATSGNDRQAMTMESSIQPTIILNYIIKT